MSVSVNSVGVNNARSLIRSGKVKDSDNWNGPSIDAENIYLKNHSINEYGKWFLATDSESDSNTKGHYKFPFSNDFEHVDIKGLKAAKSRAAQNGYFNVEKAADSLISHRNKKSKGNANVEYYTKYSVSSNGSIFIELKNIDNIDWNKE